MTRAWARIRNRAVRFIDALRRSYRDQGARGAASHAARLLGGELKLQLDVIRGYINDKRYGIETSKVVDVAALDWSAAAHDDGVRYHPSPLGHLERLLDSLPVDSPTDFTFVDMGCGKGRVLVMAAQRGFRSMVGVDLDAELLRIAAANVVAYQARHETEGAAFEFINGDVTTLRFPAGPLVIYLHNPFGEATLRDVVQNMESSWRTDPRRIIIAYYNPVHQAVFSDSELFDRLTTSSTRWAVFEADATS